MNKTRIAPTPSGFLHLGNAYNFIITLLFAEKYQAKIFLRIDDADRQRFRMDYLHDVFNTLQLLEIRIDEGPKNAEEFLSDYSQQSRHHLYNELLFHLKNKGVLYPCRLSRSMMNKHFPDGIYHGQFKEQDLDFENPEVVWRVKVPQGTVVRFHDLIQSQVEINLFEAMGDFVVRKRDQFAAYQLSSLVDDQYYGVNLVVRGNDLLTSTAAQLYLAQLGGLHSFLDIRFAHHPLLITPQGEKLSKSVIGHQSMSLCERYSSKQEVIKAIKEQVGESAFLSY
ncbi:MAG: glutamate--tRNA ligase family protein [Flavobacteriales bacterium]